MRAVEFFEVGTLYFFTTRTLRGPFQRWPTTKDERKPSNSLIDLPKRSTLKDLSTQENDQSSPVWVCRTRGSGGE